MVVEFPRRDSPACSQAYCEGVFAAMSRLERESPMPEGVLSRSWYEGYDNEVREGAWRI